MTKPPITSKRDDSFQTALNLLRQGGVRHLPFLGGKYLFGKIVVEDLMVRDTIACLLESGAEFLYEHKTAAFTVANEKEEYWVS